MKYVKRILAVTLILLPVLAVAQLGSSDTLVTQVPFKFMIGNRYVPAGECIVQSAVMGGRTLVIRNVGGKLGLFSPATPTQSKTAAGQNALVFHRYGDHAFLVGIKLAGSRTSYKLPESPQEAELRAQNAPAREEVLLASLR